MSRPAFTRDLRPSERSFVEAMSNLGFGRFEFLRVLSVRLRKGSPGYFSGK